MIIIIILGPVASAPGSTAAMKAYCSHEGLLNEPGFGSSHLYCQDPPCLQHERSLAGKGGTVGEKCPVNFAVKL
jgi:hypothetical protein